MVFLKQTLGKTGFREQIKNCASLPVQYSSRGYAIPVILESFITGIWCGANRFLHTEATRSDRASGKILTGNKYPGKMPVNVIPANLHNPSTGK
jgi:hypothetical protein